MPRSRFRRKLIPYQIGALVLLAVCSASWNQIFGQSKSNSVQTLDAQGQSPVPDFRRELLEVVEADQCTDLCDPFGGVLSLSGAMSGQCDCEWEVDGDDRSCPEDGVTCCGSLDNAGGVILYLLITLYCFLGLACVCDEWFCESLDVICEKLQLSEDVAGATFMAAGSSAPELFTAVVTVLITGGSEGLGTIIGSAVFNLVVICGTVALAAGQVLDIFWWPLTRDSVVYVGSILVMLFVLLDNTVQVWESIIMLILYGGYIYLMKRNEDITAWVEKKWPEGNGGVKTADIELTPVASDALTRAATALTGQAPRASTEGGAKQSDASQTMTPEQYMHDVHLRHHHGMNPMLRPEFRVAHTDHTAHLREEKRKEDAMALGTVLQLDKAAAGFLTQIGKTRKSVGGASASDKPKEGDEEEGGLVEKIVDVASKPLMFIFSKTIPDCRENEESYMVAFTMSIVWIGILSFVMVDFGARAGCVIGIPGLLMGLIFLSAGTSVPDALASVLVAKNGQGDMAVANVVGSNIFNILIGFAVPWLIQGIIEGGAYELPGDESITVPVIVLLLYVIFFVGCIRGNGWKLTPKVGYMFFVSEVFFIVWSLLTSLDDPVIKL